MNTILKWLGRIIGVVAILVVVAFVAGWYLMSRSLPNYEGTYTLDGLEGPVTIIRDANAVPHIRAASDHDAFFALGLVHAQDRLWQMELSRRAAQGRLSEVLGARTYEVDKLMKTLDLYGLASRSLEVQTDQTKEILVAYAKGVNAWIRQVNAEAMGRGAPEFFVFGAELSPWTPKDSLAILKVMAMRLSNGARNEVKRARTLLALPPERVVDILPEYPVGAKIVPEKSADAGGVRRATNHAWDVSHLTDNCRIGPCDEMDELAIALGTPPPASLAGASNAWAVDGQRTSSRRPLLANDPHLWLSAPSVWHLADIKGATVQAIGGALPGTPVIAVGHNGMIGWGLTTSGVDDADLYIERVNPENPDQYLLPGNTWAVFGKRTVRIGISGELSRTEVIRTTRHGPVLTGTQFGANTITPAGHVTALRWTALTDQDRSMSALVSLLYAQRIENAVAIAATVVAPAQNLTLADADGVAMVVAGAVPLRSEQSLSKGRVPSAGHISVNDWLGFMPAADNPRAIRPPTGAVANANNRTTDEKFPRHLTFDWARPYRIARLEKELMALDFHSRDGFVALQNDSVSEMARAVLPLIARDLWWREGTPAITDEKRRRALELLAEWNGEMDRHGPEPLIFMEWVRALTRRLAADELGALFPAFAGPHPLFVERVFANVDGAGIWCDVNKTPERETCAQVASIALDDALARLTRDYGSNVDGWRWGEEHVAIHRHTPFGYISPLDIFFNIENETSGGDNTLLRGQTKGTGDYPFRNIHAAGLRVVYDFADLNSSLMIISTGQSGHPFSRFYDHLAEIWANGGMIPMSTSDEDARAGALGVIELLPSGEN